MELRESAGAGRQPDSTLRRLFTPAGGSDQSLSDLGATFKGLGPNGWGRDGALDLAERFNLITAEQRAAGARLNGAGGRGVSSPSPGAAAEAAEAVEAAVRTGERAGFAAGAGLSGAGGGAAALSDNPIYRGLYAQMLMRQHGYQVQVARPEGFAAPGAPPPTATQGAADEIVERAAPLTDAVAAGVEPGAAGAAVEATDDAAARIVELERRLVDGFQRIGQLPEEQRLSTIARVLDETAAAGHGDDAYRVLATSLAERPVEQSVSVLERVLDDIARAAPAAAEAAVDAAPLAKEAVRVAPLADDVVRAAPAIDDAVRAAASAVGPATVAGAVPAADDALRHGLRGAMSFSAGLDDTLRLLAMVR